MSESKPTFVGAYEENGIVVNYNNKDTSFHTIQIESNGKIARIVLTEHFLRIAKPDALPLIVGNQILSYIKEMKKEPRGEKE